MGNVEIENTENVGEVENSLLSLLEIDSVEQEPLLSVSMRKSGDCLRDLSPSQLAWCFRVKQLAKLVPAVKYLDGNIDRCEKALRKLAAFPSETRKVPDVLAEHGIRFVIVEHLCGTKLDGTTLWLDDESPVIGMSIRYDRIDNFWFTLFHELSHVRHRDAFSVDSDITGHDELHVQLKPPHEIRADEEASASLISPEDLKSFILRVGPLYSKAKINQFANRVKIHPGIIVGQLHARHELTNGYRACREMLVKIREVVTSHALTDGWGSSIS